MPFLPNLRPPKQNGGDKRGQQNLVPDRHGYPVFNSTSNIWLYRRGIGEVRVRVEEVRVSVLRGQVLFEDADGGDGVG